MRGVKHGQSAQYEAEELKKRAKKYRKKIKEIQNHSRNKMEKNGNETRKKCFYKK